MTRTKSPGVREFLQMLTYAVLGAAALGAAVLTISTTKQLNAWGWITFGLCCTATGILFVLAAREGQRLEGRVDEASAPRYSDPEGETHVWIFRELQRLQQAFEESERPNNPQRHPDPKMRASRRRMAAAELRDEASRILAPYGGYIAQCYVIVKPQQGTRPWTSETEQQLREQLAAIDVEPILRGNADARTGRKTER